MDPIGWLLSLTDHQLNVLGTAFSILASGSTFLGILAANYARLARRDAKKSVQNTQREERIDGELYHVSVSDDTHRGTHETSELRGEIVHLLGPKLPAVHGRRRNTPTNQVPTGQEKNYE